MILIVDDDRDVRAMIGRALHELGYPSLEAESGEAALALLGENKVELVILDYMMPGMDGAETAREIAMLDPDLPIIFSTGHSALRTLRNAAGEDVSILEKPFALSELASLIAEKLAERARALP
jgi:two-component system response regulator (stage 0 sporulation protein F)